MEGRREAHMIPGSAAPAGQYSHAVTANGFAYVSGQGPVDPATKIMPEDFAGQVRQTLRNVETILKGLGLTLADVVKVNAYLSDVTRFAEYNAIYSEFFPEAPPARTTIGCQLVGILVEIDCVAAFAPTT
ncbi:RidA family protein [bacterium]|nr:MAG: RidA family protein [bacterium]